jgi:nucleotide-binding universal stress UspA family protein
MIGRPPVTLGDADHDRIMADMRRATAQVPPDVPVDLRLQEAPDIRREILRQADAINADLIVIGSRGLSGIERLLLGSVTESVMRDARCPTMVVPRRAPGAPLDEPVRFRRILCPVDFSPGSTSALHYAMKIAEGGEAQLTMLHVIETPPQRHETPSFDDAGMVLARAAAETDCLQRLNELVPQAAHAYCTVKPVVRHGVAHSEILKLARERGIDLIVMGVRGRGAIERAIFGSNTAHVTRSATCPVLIVRSDAGA